MAHNPTEDAVISYLDACAASARLAVDLPAEIECVRTSDPVCTLRFLRVLGAFHPRGIIAA